MKYSGAYESLFDPEVTVDQLLSNVRENVSSSITTVDAAVELENKLSEEASIFNQMLLTIANAKRECEAGNISREELLNIAAPCVSALKERCQALKLANVEVRDDDISESEIAMLREYIVGCKDIVASHKRDLQDCAMTNVSESYMGGNYMRSIYDSINEVRALEAFMDQVQGELEMYAAIEADTEGEAGDAGEAAGLGAKIRGAFARLRGAFKKKDQGEAQDAIEEIKETTSEIESELADAERSGDDEKKKKMKKALIIGGAAAAAIAVTVGLTVAGKNIKKSTQEEDLKGIKRGIVAISDGVLGGLRGAASVPKNVAHAVSKEGRAERAGNRRDKYSERSMQAYASGNTKKGDRLASKAAKQAAKVKKLTEAPESYLLASLAMEGTMARADYDLDIDEDDGFDPDSFDGEAQGEDMTETAQTMESCFAQYGL